MAVGSKNFDHPKFGRLAAMHLTKTARQFGQLINEMAIYSIKNTPPSNFDYVLENVFKCQYWPTLGHLEDTSI